MRASVPAFIPDRFADFLVQIVAVDDREEFTHYYQQFIATRKRTALPERKRYMRAVHERAMCDLEVRQCTWARELQEYIHILQTLECADQKMILMFLTRYGMYLEFLKQKALQHASTWHKVVSYTQNVRNKIVVLADSFL